MPPDFLDSFWAGDFVNMFTGIYVSLVDEVIGIMAFEKVSDEFFFSDVV